MLNVNVIDNVSGLIEPECMLMEEATHCIFQQYSHGKPCKTFYINCGINEPSVIVIWFNDEEDKFELSTNNKKSLNELLEHIMVRKIEAEINLELFVRKH